MTTTRTRPRLRGEVRSGLLVAAVAALVLGILGMHGFAGHDASGHGEARAERTHGIAAISSATAASDSAPARPTTDAVKPDGGAPAGMGGMAMSCGLMLAAAAITALLFLVRRSVRPRLWAVLPLVESAWRPLPGARLLGAGPPHAWRFSVIRC